MPYIDKPCMCDNEIQYIPVLGKYYCPNKNAHPNNNSFGES